MKAPGHKMILASAGSGKTYALTNRFIELMAAGAPPDRIAALTFTRKAAGEFFDEILKKLAGASVAPEEAAKIAEEIGAPRLKPADFRRMLRTMVEAMPRLTLGTLDGFFARVVRAFPLELGLGGDFEILQDQAARLERHRVVRQMFALAGAPGAAQRDFIEAFKRATFGAEEKRLTPQLDRFLEEHAETFLAARDPGAWGRAERIWPRGCEALGLVAGRAEAARALQAALAGEDLTDGQRARWEAFFTGQAGWIPGAPLPDPVEYIVGNALKAWPRVGEIMVGRKRLALAPAAAAALRAAVLGIVGAEFARRLEMTQGLCAVLQGYEAVYDGAVRRLGRLTFADLQRMLLPGADGARPLSREAAESRLFIDWRLDAQIDHWLLDEFQDTSFGQWRVLQNLVDEAVQDPTGSRSFFYVGDVKQAIFAWREGDARLFREIFRHYNAAAPGVIVEDRLDRSYRSGPAVIEMVNRVFGNSAALERLFPGPAAAQWSGEWENHTTAKPELGGYAALRPAADEDGRFAETLRILREVRPLERGLEVAVLVRTNETGAELADYLRREGGLPAVAESDLHVGKDNPLACALLALFRAAAYPRDAAARALVRLTPVEVILAERGLASPDALSAGLLREIHDGGFERTVEGWLHRLEGSLAPDDAFSRMRGRQLATAARLFDEMGGRDVAEFAAFVERYTVRDADVAGAVRVMTVHKAKGLGFDLAILPDLEGKTLAARRRGLAVQKAPDRSVAWVLNLPARELALSDPVLGAHVAAAEADACYENLCLLYVAMTRAKRAMYVVTQPAEKSASLNFPRLLRETLGESWESGDPRWFESIRAEDGPESPAAGGLRPLAAPAAPRRAALRPSARHAGVFAAAPLFELAPAAGAEFGTAVHNWLAKVEWAGDAAVGEIGRAAGEAAAEAAACLAAPELAEVWARPPGAEAWRERTFELVLDQAWVTGVFDRVVVTRDAQGKALRAAVCDFKTDQAEGEAGVADALARHSGQLGIYRRAAAVLTGLPLEKVSAELVLTRRRMRVPVAE